MKSNPFYIIWGIVSVLLLGGAGFFLFSSKSAFSETENSFKEKEATINRLTKKKPYPDAKGVEEMEKLVADFAAEVDGLYDSLSSFQHPLEQGLSADQFPNLVLAKKTAFEKAAAEKGMVIKGTGDDEFYFGMDAYRGSLPASENVPLLNYQLEAIDRLLELMLESGVDTLHKIDREPLWPEMNPGQPDPEASAAVIRYALSVRFVADHSAFQKFTNALANDDQFFFLLRVLRIDNTSPTGTKITDGVAQLGGLPDFRDKEGSPPSDEVLATVADLEVGEAVEQMATLGFSPVSEDAKVLFGDEKLRVFAIIDVARFPTEEERKVEPADDGNKRPSRK
jgi:hypothetical protein